MTRNLMKLSSGRQVAVHTMAQGTSGRTVIFCHAAPGSGAFDPDPAVTQAREVTLIGVDRPGYGGSDPVAGDEWASVGQAADDLAEVVRALDTGPIGLVGWSGGGRIALALAARQAGLVDRVAVVATPAPDEEVPWIPSEQRAGLEAMREMPVGQVHELLGGQLSAMISDDPEARLALVGADGSVDEAGRQRLAAMMDEAFAQGVTGLTADIAGYCLRPWGFEPSEVDTPTLLLYGSADPVAGPAHGRWYEERLPDAHYEEVPDAGHLLVIPTWDRVLSYVSEKR